MVPICVSAALALQTESLLPAVAVVVREATGLPQVVDSLVAPSQVAKYRVEPRLAREQHPPEHHRYSEPLELALARLTLRVPVVVAGGEVTQTLEHMAVVADQAIRFRVLTTSCTLRVEMLAMVLSPLPTLRSLKFRPESKRFPVRRRTQLLGTAQIFLAPMAIEFMVAQLLTQPR